MPVLTAILLAAGEGDRFNSKHPKLIHPLAGWPMLEYGLALAKAAGASKILLVAPSTKHPVALLAGKRVTVVSQPKPLGTGDALRKALSHPACGSGDVLVLYGDVPLLRPQTVQAMRQVHALGNAAATLVTTFMADPYGYGRIVRGGEGNILRVVEELDATFEERKIKEINGGSYIFQAAVLKGVLSGMKPKNAGGEVYLTDAVQALIEKGNLVDALTVPDASEVLGINTRPQFAAGHRILNRRRVAEWERKGVTFLDPKTVEIGPQVVIGRDTVVEGSIRLEGETSVGEDCRLESGTVLVNARLGRSVVVRSSRVLDSSLGDGSDAGPHAHVRGGSKVEAGCHIGTGTELKNVKFGKGSKAGHFSYLGDATVGKGVNVGAGCVIANYDGKKKHPTKVGDGAFLGSNCTLVAPVTVGAKAVVGAGAVVTRNVPPKAVVVGVPAKGMGSRGGPVGRRSR